MRVIDLISKLQQAVQDHGSGIHVFLSDSPDGKFIASIGSMIFDKELNSLILVTTED